MSTREMCTLGVHSAEWYVGETCLSCGDSRTWTAAEGAAKISECELTITVSDRVAVATTDDGTLFVAEDETRGGPRYTARLSPCPWCLGPESDVVFAVASGPLTGRHIEIVNGHSCPGSGAVNDHELGDAPHWLAWWLFCLTEPGFED